MRIAMLTSSIICGLSVLLLLLIVIYFALYRIVRRGTICKVSRPYHSELDNSEEEDS